MKLSAKGNKEFTPAPEFTGRAVCVDVTPPEMKQTDFGLKEKFKIVFELDLENPDRPGERHCVWSRGFTTSLNEKALLRKFLRTWFGRDLTAQELEEFDTESLIGKPAFIVVTHNHGDNGETYADITACTPHKQGEPLAPSGKFTRKQDRDAKKSETGGTAATGSGASYRKAEQPSAVAGDGNAGPLVSRDTWMSVKVHVGKHAGIDLGDLDEDAVRALIAKWLPVAKANPKPKADDKRLMAALELALAAIEEAKAAQAPAPAAADY